jgi:hypothetical protein
MKMCNAECPHGDANQCDWCIERRRNEVAAIAKEAIRDNLLECQRLLNLLLAKVDHNGN